MRLKKLEIYGFKSFAERTEIVFEQGTTGIVGPNGSGKSNISDAVRWVLGEQSAKQLRGAKMEDIIFNGTEKRKPLAWCEVSLLFDNEDHALPMDCAELEVTRRVYRNGNSEYYLNRAACRLKDITDLFRDTGIGKEGYSLIGQGRIDEILSVKSEDRRNIFEEAVGIVKYKARKQEAERSMENTRQNITRMEDILDELARQLGPLEEQSRVARRYLALQDALQRLELNAFLVHHDRFQARLSDTQALLTGLDESILEAERQRDTLKNRREKQEALAQDLDLQAEAARRDVLDLTRQMQALQGENSVLGERIAHGEADEARLERSLSETLAQREEVRTQTARHEDQRSSQAEALDETKERLRQAEHHLRECLDQEGADEQALEAHKSAIIAAMNRLSDMRSTKARLSAMRQTLETRLDETRGEQTAHAALEETLLQNVEAAQRSGQAVAETLAWLQNEAQALEKRLRGVATETEALEARRQAQTAKTHETASRLRMLKEMARDYEGYQHAVKQVLVYAREDSGVHGVVASLLQAPAELERAIEMALGGALQNVVVETEQDAKRMIEYLRQNRYGRATFLPINTVRGRTLNAEERGALAVPGCLGVASELIHFDERYRGVVENLLGRTVIAENLDVGIEVMRRGRHAFRLVTLEGDVMHSGGSMTGGSVQSRMTSLLSRQREIAEHELALQHLNEAQEETREKLASLEQARSADKRVRSELYARVHQEDIAAAREQERLTNAQAALASHRDKTLALATQLEQMRETLADIESQLARSDESQDSAQVDQQEMQQRTLALQEILAGARRRSEAGRERLTQCKVVLASQEQAAGDQQREQKRLQAALVKLSLTLQTLQSQLRECRDQRTRNQALYSQGQADSARHQKALEERQAALEGLDLQRAKVQALLRDIRSQEERVAQRILDETERRHRAALQQARLEGERKALQDRIWNTYELTYAGALEWKQEGFDLAEAEKAIEEHRREIREMGPVNVHAVEEYQHAAERHSLLSAQRQDLLRTMEDLQGIIDELLVKMERRFRQQFQLLNENFQQTFTALFGGGTAALKLTDESNVLECGIEIVAQPPGKRLQLLSLLSGGERALTAIAILFAMLQLKPTPFCVLDEIEAALDEANVAHFADFLVNYAASTQFVVVTHRKGTMERCQALYGVAMAERGVSRMVSVRLEDALA